MVLGPPDRWSGGPAVGYTIQEDFDIILISQHETLKLKFAYFHSMKF